MKHIFFVHSHITFLIANSYIHDNRILHEDTLFVLSKRYPQVQQGYEYPNSILYPDDFFSNGSTRVFEKRNLLKGMSNIVHVERLIKSFLSHDPFYLYLINTSSDIHSTLVTMPQCFGYFVLEEGASSYVSKREFDAAYPNNINRFIVNFLRIIPILRRFYALKDCVISINNHWFLGTIASSSDTFPYLNMKKIVVSNPFSKVQLKIVPDIILSIDVSLFFSFGDEFPDRLFVFLSKYLSQNHYKFIAYKFHPCFYSQHVLIDKYRVELKRILPKDSYELPRDCIIENVLYTYHSDFLSDFSTIGIYASNFGCKCLSYLTVVPVLYPNSDYQEHYLDKISDVIRRTYSFIDSSELEQSLS